MIEDFKDKVAVVTGGTSGIGLAIVRDCLDRGMKVAMTGSRPESLQRGLDALGSTDRVAAILSDAGDRDANIALAAEVQQRLGPVDLLCLNAGVSRLAPVQSLTIAEWDRIIAVNLNGPFYALKAFLPQLESRPQAHVTFTSSVLGFFSTDLQAPYFASKAGLTALAESLFYDLAAADSNVGVSLLCPGNTRTNMAAAGLTGDEPQELADAIRAELSEGADPAVVAQALLDAAKTGTFYVFPNTGEFRQFIEARFDRILEGRNPTAADVGDAI